MYISRIKQFPNTNYILWKALKNVVIQCFHFLFLAGGELQGYNLYFISVLYLCLFYFASIFWDNFLKRLMIHLMFVFLLYIKDIILAHDQDPNMWPYNIIAALEVTVGCFIGPILLSFIFTWKVPFVHSQVLLLYACSAYEALVIYCDDSHRTLLLVL